MSIGLFSFAAVAQFAPALPGRALLEGGDARRRARRASAPASWCGSTRCSSPRSPGRAGCRHEHRRAGPVRDRGPDCRCSSSASAALDEITHGVLWTMLANVGAYVGVSLATEQSAVERSQATLFVDVVQALRAPAPARSSGAAASRSRSCARSSPASSAPRRRTTSSRATPGSATSRRPSRWRRTPTSSSSRRRSSRARSAARRPTPWWPRW